MKSDWTPSSVQYVLYLAQDGSNFLHIQVVASGALQLRVESSAGINWTISSIPNTFADGSVHMCVIAVDRDGNATWYFDGVAAGATAISADAAKTLTATGTRYLGGTSGASYSDTFFAFAPYNRVLTAVDVLRLFRFWIDPADKYGCQTSKITNPEFTTDTTGWSGSNYTQSRVDSAVDPGSSSGGSDDYCLKNVATGASSRTMFQSASISAPKGARIDVNFRYYVPFGDPDAYCSIKNSPFTPITVTTGNLTTKDAWTYVEGYVVLTQDDMTLAFVVGNISSGGAVGDVIYLDSFDYYVRGATIDLNPSGVQPAPGQWLDAGANKLHAMQPASGSSRVFQHPKILEVRWTNIWAGTHEAQYIGGVNQNVLPSNNIRIESITMVATATGVNVIVGDGSDTDRFVASVALATYLDCTIANRNHDGTNRKLTIDPDGNFTGSISTTIKGIILD
jgi:hypothetical protein